MGDLVFAECEVNHGEAVYLDAYYPPDQRTLMRERITLALTRLSRKGIAAQQIHAAYAVGIKLFHAHRLQMADSPARDKAVTRARKDLDRAIKSLRRLLPDGIGFIPDDVVLEQWQLLLGAGRPAPRPRGRPQGTWKHATEQALQQAGVGKADRHELLSAIGFLPDG